MTTTRRKFLKGLVTSGIALSTLNARNLGLSNFTSISQPSSLEEIFNESIIVDDLGGFHPNPSLPDHGFSNLKQSGLTMGSGGIGSVVAEESLQSWMDSFSRTASMIDRYKDRMMLILNFSDIYVAKKEKKYGLLLNVQSADAIEPHLKNLDLFYKNGLRQIQLTHNWRTYFGDGCTEKSQAGLSYFGVELVEKMNELGMIVDVSHCCYKTTMDAIEASKKPIVFSHTNCKALCDNPRDKSDEEIKALARKGGVMGMSHFNWFVSDKPRANLEDLLDHYDHAIRLVGPDYVGIGSDFGVYPYSTVPDESWEKSKSLYNERDWKAIKGRFPPYIEEVNGAHRYWTVAQGLKKRGYSLADIQKILGLNFVRVFKEVLKP